MEEIAIAIYEHNDIPLAFVVKRMVDDKNDRDKQADDAERCQRERELNEARERADEAEPAREEPGRRLGDLDEALETHNYPTTTDELITAFGDHKVKTQRGWASIDDVFAPADNKTFDSPDDVRNRILKLIHRR